MSLRTWKWSPPPWGIHRCVCGTWLSSHVSSQAGSSLGQAPVLQPPLEEAEKLQRRAEESGLSKPPRPKATLKTQNSCNSHATVTSPWSLVDFLSHFSWLFVSLKSGTYFEVRSHMSLVRSENIWRVHRCGDEAAQMQLRSKHEVSGGRNNPSIGKAHLKRLPHVAILRTRQIGFTIDFSQRQLWSNSSMS